MLLHSFLGSCELREVVVESVVVAVSEIVRGKVGFRQRGVVHGHFNDVQDVEPIHVLALGDQDELLDGFIHHLGMPIRLGMKGT